MLDWYDIYSNISVLIKDWDIVIGGKPYTGPLVLVERNGRVALTLDLDSVMLLPGDYIRVNMILMPWGDRNSNDDSNVRLTPKGAQIAGTLYAQYARLREFFEKQVGLDAQNAKQDAVCSLCALSEKSREWMMRFAQE